MTNWVEAQKWLELKKTGLNEQADQYFDQTLYPLVEEKFLADAERMGVKGSYDMLIFPLGARWHYPVLAIKAIQPKRAYFICTPRIEEKTLGKVLEKSGLAPFQTKKDVVEYSGMDLEEVYAKVKGVVNKFPGDRIAVDLSRGKRVMTTGIGIAAAFCECDFTYIDEDWNFEINDGIPGTERLVMVKNPFKHLGEIDRERAKELFNRGSFQPAAEIYSKLSNQSPDPRESSAYELFCQAFSQWDLFNYRGALFKLRETEGKARQYSIKLPDLKRNFTALEELAALQAQKEKFFEVIRQPRACMRLVADAYANSLRRAETDRFDDAVGRLYRAIELVSQHRLALRGLDCATPDFDSLGVSGLQEAFAKATGEVYGQSKPLPGAVALADGHILLLILQDEFWKGRQTSDLRKLVDELKARDHSMSAHGMRPVDQKDFLKLKNTAREFADKLFSINNANFDAMLLEHSFPKI